MRPACGESSGSAAEKSGWGRKLPRGRGMGLGYYFCHQGYIAEVAEVTVSPAGDLKVDRVVAAVDVGSQIVNLSGAENQVQGSIIDGLSAAWRQELDIERGRVVEGNFDQYALLRIPDAPRQIDIHFLKTDLPSDGPGRAVPAARLRRPWRMRSSPPPACASASCRSPGRNCSGPSRNFVTYSGQPAARRARPGCPGAWRSALHAEESAVALEPVVELLRVIVRIVGCGGGIEQAQPGRPAASRSSAPWRPPRCR